MLLTRRFARQLLVDTVTLSLLHDEVISTMPVLLPLPYVTVTGNVPLPETVFVVGETLINSPVAFKVNTVLLVLL